jgi:hypothetical protein
MSSPNCHWEGCEGERDFDSLVCRLHHRPPLQVEEALLTILAALDKKYRLAAAVPGVVDMAPDQVAALRVGRALFGIVEKEAGDAG